MVLYWVSGTNDNFENQKKKPKQFLREDSRNDEERALNREDSRTIRERHAYPAPQKHQDPNYP